MDASAINETRPLIADGHHRDNLPPAPPSLAIQSSARNHALDNLRTFLTALVILHHTSIVYGGAGGWKIRSRCFPPVSITLLTFNAIDQTFFMALFFFISGHFTRIQISKRRVTRSAVIRSRLIRILLPAVVYTMLVEPTLNVMVWAWDKGASLGAFAHVWSIYFSYWTHVRGIRGPVWYLALVMIFDFITVSFLWSVKGPGPGVRRHLLPPSKRFWAPLMWVLTILSSFAVRLVYPCGKVWAPLSLQLGYLPQYVLAYFGGSFSAVSDDLFILIPFQYYTRGNAVRKLFRSLMLSLSSLGLLTVMEATMMGIDIERVSQLTRGGFNIPALGYAAWNEAGFALNGFALVAAFVRYCDVPWTCGKVWLPRYSYGAFLLHPPVSVGIELALESFMGCQSGDHRSHHGLWPLFGPVLLTIVVGLVNILASWTAAWVLLSAVPLARKII